MGSQFKVGKKLRIRRQVMARDFKTEEYSCVCVCVCVRVCVCVWGGGGVSKSTSHAPLTPPPSSIFKKPEQFSLLTIFDWS